MFKTAQLVGIIGLDASVALLNYEKAADLAQDLTTSIDVFIGLSHKDWEFLLTIIEVFAGFVGLILTILKIYSWTKKSILPKFTKEQRGDVSEEEDTENPSD